MTSHRRLAALLLALLPVLAPGCADCGRCIDHEVILRVRSTDGGAVSDVTVTGSGVEGEVIQACNVGSTETVCTGSVYYGDVVLVVEAPGFEPVTLERSFPNPNGPNCSCDHRDLDEVVELTPSS